MITDKQKEIAAKNIKQYRKILGYNQTQFAEELGYGKSTIGDWENGNIPNDIARLEDIAEQLNMSIDELLNEEKEYEIPKEYKKITEQLLEKIFVELALIPECREEQNTIFNQLYKKHIDILEVSENSDLEKKIDNSINLICLYEKEYNENKNILCIINSLKLYAYISAFTKPFINDDKYDSLGFFNIDLKIITKMEHQLKKKKITEEERKAITKAKTFILQQQNKIFEKIKIIKKDKEYNELADVYLPLFYLMNTINNDNSPKHNKIIGQELLLIAIETENKFININIPDEPEV